MQHAGHVAFSPSPFCLIEIPLIFVDEPLSGGAGIDEDHLRVANPPLLY